MKPKKWYKDKSRKEIAGVIAGLYDYLTCMKTMVGS